MNLLFRGLGRIFFVVIYKSVLLAAPVDLAPQSQIQEIVVSDQVEKGLQLKKGEINRVGSVRPKELERKQAQTFAQAIDNERGIDTQTACAFCGAKRVSINGMRGEHTTILVDGLPLHSTVSGFYGIEAIPMGGIDSIDIYRGAGAALTAPESIGGAINIVTKEVVSDEFLGNISYGSDGQKTASILGAKRISEKTGFFVAVQQGESFVIDLDKNGVAELPGQKTQTLISKLNYKINDDDEISLRFSYGKLEGVGGSMNGLKLMEAPSLATSDDFLNRDVRSKYLGSESKITENIELVRQEWASIYRNQLDEDSSLKFSIGTAKQFQKSIYSHGYDYDNLDNLWVGAFEYQRALMADHLLTFGLDTKNQKMDSSSRKLYVQRVPPLNEDDLIFSSLGGFAQDTWFINDSHELSLVLRLDKIRTEWTDLNKTIDKTVIAPRAMYKLVHNPILTSRVSLGVGYRSPLTLFESQHGMIHDGFLININELEMAKGFLYSLAGQRQDDFFEFSSHITRIENMAYGMDRVGQKLPTLFKNSEEAYTVSVFDFSYGRRLTHNWTLEGLVEIFNYPGGYKEKLGVAAVERRLTLTSNIEWNQWSAFQKLTFIGARDLAAYGYGKHYNRAPSEDTLDPSFGTKAEDQKWQKAPAYFSLDFGFERKLTEKFGAGISVLNAFDYTQTREGDSPLTWHEHGDHYHLDNFHIWGPLRGRQIFLSLKGDF